MREPAAAALALAVGLVLSGCQLVARPAAEVASRPSDSSAPVIWSKNRLLTWEDFRGEAPPDKRRQGSINRLAGSVGLAHSTYEAAETVSSVSRATYRFSYTCTSNPGAATRCRLSTFDLEPVHAEFDRSTSWVIPEEQTPQLLRHEQGHFDIAAIHAAKLQDELRAALAAGIGNLEPEGGDQASAERTLTSEIEAAVDAIRDDVMRQFSAAQARYDAETKHGTDATVQRRWTAELDGELRR